MAFAKWKDIAELIALVAVVLSLVAVAYELRQTRDALMAQAYQARAFDGIATNFEYAKDPELDRVGELALAPDFAPETLTAEERRVLRRLYSITRIDLDNEHYQFQKGFLDPSFYRGETEQWIREAAPIWRALGQPEPRAAFRQEVDRILSDDSHQEIATP